LVLVHAIAADNHLATVGASLDECRFQPFERLAADEGTHEHLRLPRIATGMLRYAAASRSTTASAIDS